MCVFTDKRYIKYASLALVPIVAINTYVGYKMNNAKVVFEVEQVDTVIEEVISSSDFEFNFDVGSNDNLEVSANNISAFESLWNIYQTSGMNIGEILSSVSKNEDLYASALYARLKEFSLLDDVIKAELDNIICFGTQAMCLSEEKWNELFGNLVKTVGEFDNVIDVYYPLASYTHCYSCGLEHESLFFDENRITCGNIESMYNEKNPQIDFREYFTQMVMASEDIKLINTFKRIEKLNNFEEAMNELESVYQFAPIYDTLSDSLKEGIFTILPCTLVNGENLFDTYYDLAYYFHSLWCDLEHSILENGKYECVDYSLTL